MLQLPKPIAWGRDNERRACLEYVRFMKVNGHPRLEVSPAGFVVHPDKCWLGATPDAWVVDPSSDPSCGIAEFKYLFTKRHEPPEKACEDPDFYCSMINASLHLKRDHLYYHQVQLQLFVAFDKCQWCDFCIFSGDSVAVERIYPDSQWQSISCSQLDHYFFEHIIPEVMNPKCKPAYYL